MRNNLPVNYRSFASIIRARGFGLHHSSQLILLALLLTFLSLQAAAVSEPPVVLDGDNASTAKPSQGTSTTVAAMPDAPGWTCMGDSGEDWDCSLSGPDPKEIPEKGLVTEIKEAVLPDSLGTDENAQEKSKASLLRDENKGLGIIALDSQVAQFDIEDDRIFNTLQQMAGTDAWGTCGNMIGPVQPVESWVPGQTTVIEADYTEVYEQDIASFSGDVELTRATQKVFADQATYDRTAETLAAQGNVRFREPDISLAGDRVFVKEKTGQARLQDARFLMENIPARGRAGTAYRESPTVTRFRNIAYTTCQPGQNDWVLGAEHLKIDQATGRATARHAWLRLGDVPVFYTPYISFPTDDRRKSGFLAPSFGSSDETGFDASVPWYWNIAPHMDATFTPRYVTKRGAMMGAEYRYLTDWSEGYISGEYMPSDSERDDDARGQFTIYNESQFTPFLSGKADINFVSDDDYLDDLGNTLSFSNTSHVKSEAWLSYNRWGMSLTTRVQNWQTIDDTIKSSSIPYKKLPQITFNVSDRPITGNLRAGLGSEFVYFSNSHRVSGKRADFTPHITYPVRTAYSYVTPKLTLDHTQYWYDSDHDDYSVDSSDSRTLPILSVDSGLFFERDTSFGSTNYTQTLEPRAFYLYVPYDNQSDIPNFDTARYDFSFNQLFRENRFAGRDRIGDANQLTLAMTTRYINSATGLERLRASLGTIFYFKDLKVHLPGEDDYTESTSNIVGELNTQLTNFWSFRSAFQWNPNTSTGDNGNSGDRQQVSLHYKNTQSKLFNVAYRYRKDLIEQVDSSLRWPVPFTENWHTVGRMQYSLRDSIILDSFLGLERDSCCWRFRVLGRRYTNDGNEEYNTGFFVQLELKGFTSFGDDVDSFLERSISGYRRPEY